MVYNGILLEHWDFCDDFYWASIVVFFAGFSLFKGCNVRLKNIHKKVKGLFEHLH